MARLESWGRVLFYHKHTDTPNLHVTYLPLDRHNKCIQLDVIKAGGCVAAVMEILRNPILAVTKHKRFELLPTLFGSVSFVILFVSPWF